MSEALKIDLGCGRKLYGKGWTGIDKSKYSAAKYKIDFTKTSLPFPDETVDEIRSEHTFEHINGVDLIFLMNECWRVMKWGTRLWIYVPEVWCDLAWQDPTHKNYFVESSFKFFCGDYLIKHKLDYGIKCIFYEFQEPKREYPSGSSEKEKQYCTMLKFCLLKNKKHYNDRKNKFPFNIKNEGKAVPPEAQTQLDLKPKRPVNTEKSRHDPEWFLNTRWKTEHNVAFSDTVKRVAKRAINKHITKIMRIKIDASKRYGSDPAPLGTKGLFADLNRKFRRTERFFWDRVQDTGNENILDTLYDGAVYYILMAMAFEQELLEERERNDG